MSLQREAQIRRRIVDIAAGTGDADLMMRTYRENEHALRYDAVHARRKQSLWNAASRVGARAGILFESGGLCA